MAEPEKTRAGWSGAWQKPKNWARTLKRDIFALYYAMRHPLTPWYAKAAAAVVVGYALSPLDLIPDFVPVLGYLDDLILVPLGIALVIRLLPSAVLEACRRQAAQNRPAAGPQSRVAAVVIVGLWLLAAYGLFRTFR